jgi:tRNA(Glu) U13 pseudouridine synthase TruD
VRATGPLPGDLRLQPSSERDADERAWSAVTGIDWAWFQRGAPLSSPGERRPLLALLRERPELARNGEIWQLSLSLPPGCYATEVLDQLGIAVPENRR